MQAAGSSSSATSVPLYQESISAPKWLAGVILAGMAFVGLMIGFEATRNSLEGGERLLFM